MPTKILFLTLVLLIGLGVSADVSDDWTAVQRDIVLPLDLENTPLEIKTDSTLGSEDQVVVWFYPTQRERASGVEIYFTSTPQYYLYWCRSWTNFPSNLPSEVDKIWRITLDKTAGIRIQIHCNGVEVVNVLMSDNTCSGSRWRKYWSRDVENIYFSSVKDTASDYYRAGQTDCTGLKTEWMSTLETTTQFPVDPGTVVEVTCSETGAINTGSSEVTCTSGRLFTYQEEPNCVIPDRTSEELKRRRETISCRPTEKL